MRYLVNKTSMNVKLVQTPLNLKQTGISTETSEKLIKSTTSHQLTFKLQNYTHHMRFYKVP